MRKGFVLSWQPERLIEAIESRLTCSTEVRVAVVGKKMCVRSEKSSRCCCVEKIVLLLSRGARSYLKTVIYRS